MSLAAVCAIALAFGFVGSMPLAGPIALLVLSRATRGRYREALGIGVAAAAAEAIYAGLAFWGFATFLARHAIMVPISHGVTAAIFVALGVRFLFWHPAQGGGPVPARGAGTFVVGFSVSALNPTLLLTWSAAVALLYSKGLRDESPSHAVPFGLAAGAGIGAWFVVLVALVRRYGGKLPEAAVTWTVRVLGLVLAVIGAGSAVRLVGWIGGRR